MITPQRSLRLAIAPFLLVLLSLATAAAEQTLKEIPEPLQIWKGWATWNDPDRACPAPYQDPNKRLCFWPSRLALDIASDSGRFELSVTVFSDSWIPLPGGERVWPVEVKVNGLPSPVVEHDGHPSVRLGAGVHRLEGSYRWNEIPQSIPVPREIGILSLKLEGTSVESPEWDATGALWLKRDTSPEEADRDFIGVKVYAVLEDGIPLWLRSEVELIVSGKSREEEIGSVLPEGWKLAAVNSPIPVAVDDAGRIRAQVRTGKWTLRLDAFQLDNIKEIGFSPGVKPAVADVLIAFRSRPDFRMVEIGGAPSVDVSQTTFPEKWRNLPVFRWETASPLRIEERMRGMGMQQPEGLKIARALWLDEDGRAVTFRDQINGRMQQIWRLDAAPGQDLGSVRSGGQGQLITRNPQNGAPGVEIRTRDINLEATGRIERVKQISAAGWRSDADALNVTLNLPPGWRLFALFGADWVRGDWLTAWTLLDLFLLLVFSLAVLRLWGLGAALLAFVALGLSYHEPGAPRYVWLALLIPLALLRVVPAGWGTRLVKVWKWLTIAVFVFVVVPFVARQVQQALYPQLENTGPTAVTPFAAPDIEGSRIESPAPSEAPSRGYGKIVPPGKPAKQDVNLLYEADARIQTGPGVPEWSWRTVTFGWNGPVLASQQVRLILISLSLERVLTVLRIIFLLALASILLNARGLRSLFYGAPGKAAILLLLLASPLASAHSQMPDAEMLETLRKRLLETSDAYPTAADISFVSLKLEGRRVTMDAEIHAAIRTAVPLPGQLPAWSPVSVLVDGKGDIAMRRDDGYLWVVLPEGVHHVRVEGLLAGADEWAWTFQLKPRRVSIEAPAWTVSGVRADGVPEQQVFFALKQKVAPGAASYDRQDFQTVAAVDRNLELGLVWQARTKVTRLSPDGKAIALRIPLLSGENVLSANAVVSEGFIEVRLGANESEFTWESELPVGDRIRLTTKADDAWVERWHLVASPVWNLAISGLAPTFEPGNPLLIPVWRPWPGEGVEIAVSRPEAIAGATVTIDRATHEMALGKRQRVSKLDLSLRCSLGQDFLADIPAEAEVTSLSRGGEAIPVRKEGARVTIPLRPGEQTVSLGWKINMPLSFRALAGEVRLPVESANINTFIRVPEDRWILWADGPLRGPAVRFWSILVCAMLAAWVLGRLSLSPLRSFEWMLLAIGLTQVPLPAALVIIGWLFFLVWRGRASFLALPPWGYNLLQVALIVLTAAALGVFVAVVAEGLLGNPEMFIVGNGSSRTLLSWYEPRSGATLPRPGCFSVSIWWYRLLMLFWALWLAASLIRWLRWGWQQFSGGGCFRRMGQKALTPPPVPSQG